MIRPGKLSDLPDILRITQACAADLCARGIFQWNEAYPSAAVLRSDLERGELWVLELDKRPVGMVVLTGQMDAEYKAVRWLGPESAHRYVHRLAVHPDFQGRGIARQLMDFAEERAREEGADSVRLDTFSKNLRNQRFYENRGYTRLEAVWFPMQSPHPFYCYELPLSLTGGSSTEP